MRDFPEPVQWNGGPDEDTYLDRPTGPRTEPPAVDYYSGTRGSPCYGCGRAVHRVYTLAGVGVFCSPGCRSKAMELPTPTAMDQVRR